MGEGPLDLVPLWVLIFLNIAVVVLSVEAGYLLGQYRHARAPREKDAPVGAMAGATLGLLAFLLAFTFGLAAARFDARRHVVLDEANAIGTAYLRAEMLPEADRAPVRKLLRDYVDVRLGVVRTGDLEHVMRRSEELHGQLWARAAAAGNQNPHSIVIGLYVQSLNEVIDLHAKRLSVGVRSRIPGTVWLVLYVVAILSLATMGYHAGLVETSRSLAVLGVAITFSAVMWVIADLDRPREGFLQVSQQAMIDLRDSMKEPER